MLIGATLWQFSPDLPGPLSLAWMYKASSTIDSMIGYKHGNLRWLGTAGARLDDILTWIPCRLVLITTPLICKEWKHVPIIIKSAFQDGSKDESPNSGLSEAIFAHCVGIKMGGINSYKNQYSIKPILAAKAPQASKESIQVLMKLILKVEIFWLVIIGAITLVI